MYELVIKRASNNFGGGNYVGVIKFKNRPIATIGAGTIDGIEDAYNRFLSQRDPSYMKGVHV